MFEVSDLRSDMDAWLAASPAELSHESPEVQAMVAAAKVQNARRARLDDPGAQPHDRLTAYLEIAGDGRKRYRRGDDVPTLTKLGEYVGRDRTSVRAVATAVRVDREIYLTLLCLGAIFPGPAAEQYPGIARRQRAAAADAWLEEPTGISLLDWLWEFASHPDAYEVEVQYDIGYRNR